MGRPEIPPIPWFERIVSTAARQFLIQGGPMPFEDIRADTSDEAAPPLGEAGS
jgi:hypothetical protein